MEKIKVLQVNKLYYPEIGGIEKTLQQLAEGLNDKTDMKVLVCQKKGKGCQETINGVKVYRAGSMGVIASVPISFSFIWKFRQLAKDRDVVHLHMPFPLGDLACLLSGYKGKVVVYWHSDVVKQKRWMYLYKPIMKMFLKRVDLVLVGAVGIAKGSNYLTPYMQKCKVIPFAVEDKILEDGKRYLLERGYDRKHEVLRFLFVGRLVYYKGCSVLLEAFSSINAKAQLIMIGSGEQDKELRERSKQLKISDKVLFAGNVSPEEMKNYFEEADVFVLPSTERSEAFALVQLEAMSYGLPVINTNLPSGVPEVSIHMKTGLTVEPSQVKPLIEAMEWMAEHWEQRIDMGIAARERVEMYYTQTKMISNVQKAYSELIKEK